MMQLWLDGNCLRFANPAEAELRTSVYPSNFAPISTKLRENTFRMICNFRFLTLKICFGIVFFIFSLIFVLFSADFGGARLFLTSKSGSLRYFASDGQIFKWPPGIYFGRKIARRFGFIVDVSACTFRRARFVVHVSSCTFRRTPFGVELFCQLANWPIDPLANRPIGPLAN